MNRGEWLELATQAYDLSLMQQKTFRSDRDDNGKRDPRSLYTNNLRWKYVAVIMQQVFKLDEALLHVTSDTEKGERRLRLLSVIVSYLTRFVSLNEEDHSLTDSRSTIKNRGTVHHE